MIHFLKQWSLDHLKMYTLNDVQSSLLPELLNPDDNVLSVASTAKARITVIVMIQLVLVFLLSLLSTEGKTES